MDCPFCQLDDTQTIVLSNELCMFLQQPLARQKGVPLEGAGIIVPKAHRETAFELTPEEWQATYALLHEVKQYIDTHYAPVGYNLGWNCGSAAGQHFPHAHFHVLPRYADEPMIGKGIRHLFKGELNQRSQKR